MRSRSLRNAILLLLAIAACGNAATPSPESATSSLGRDTAPIVSDVERASLVSGNNAFALDLYRSLRSATPAKNIFFSPYSASIALAMTYAGARGSTADEMARALHFVLPADRLHAAFDGLDLQLASAPASARDLRIADSVWSDRSMHFESAFLDTLAADYGAGVRLVDFAGNAASAVDAINAWVDEKTNGKIDTLVTRESVDADTRLFLVNAVYFRAGWSAPFPNAVPKSFTTASGATVAAPLMTSDFFPPYAEGDGWKAIRLMFGMGETSMLVIVPTLGTLDAFEATLDADRIASIVSAMTIEHTTVTLPKLMLAPDAMDLVPHLKGLGMISAFDPASADLSGMTGNRELFVHAVVQRTFLHVDENGTEAAAATGVGSTLVSAPNKEITADHPFLLAIRDEATGALLFVARVVDPSQ